MADAFAQWVSGYNPMDMYSPPVAGFRQKPRRHGPADLRICSGIGVGSIYMDMYSVTGNRQGQL